MKQSIFILLMIPLLIIPFSCTKEEICACNVDHPEENIPWLKDFLSNKSYANVYKLVLDGKEYIICIQAPSNDAVSLVFDCSGNLLCKSGKNYSGENTCYYLTPSWDSEYQKRELIFEKRSYK